MDVLVVLVRLTRAVSCGADSLLCGCSKGHLIALDIIRGLVFLHSNKVVHADLKAKNVLLTQNAGMPLLF